MINKVVNKFILSNKVPSAATTPIYRGKSTSYATVSIVEALTGLHLTGSQSEREKVYNTLTNNKNVINYSKLPKIKTACIEKLKELFPELNNLVSKHSEQLLNPNLKTRKELLEKIVKNFGEYHVEIPEGSVKLKINKTA